MADEHAPEGASRAGAGPWYRRPQAIIGMLALLVPLGIAAALIVNVLTGNANQDRRAPDPVEEPIGEPAPTATPRPAPEEPDEPDPAPVEEEPAPPAPRPEPEPEPEPEPPPRPAPEPEDRGPEPQPQRVTGNGSGRTDPLVHEGGLAVFTIRHRGQERFGVAAEGEGRRVRLVSREGEYDGSRAIVLPAGEYPLDITADGDWLVSLRQPRHREGATLPVRFTGDGDRASAPFATTGGEIRVRVHHEGEGGIVVRMLDAEGTRWRQLVRARGPGSTTRVGRAAAGLYLFDVQAAGPWTIEVREGSGG